MKLPDGVVIYRGRIPPHQRQTLPILEFDDEEVYGPAFRSRVASSGTLVILDPLSFPWELFPEYQGETAVYVSLAGKAPDSEEIRALRPILENLTFYDRIVTSREGDEGLERYIAGVSPVKIVRAAADELDSIGIDLDERIAVLAADAIGRRPATAASKALHRIRDEKIASKAQTSAIGRALTKYRPGDAEWRAADFGCGEGRLLAEIELRGGKPIGIDKSTAALSKCRARCPDADLYEADITQTNPLKEDIDIALFVEMLVDVKDRRSAFKNAWQALRPGGVMICLERMVRGASGGETLGLNWKDFQSMVIRATCNSVALEHFETLTYPRSSTTDSALVVLRKLGSVSDDP